MQLTLEVGTIDIKGELISEHYLEDRLKNTKRFIELAQEAEKKFEDVKAIYEDVKSTVEFDDEEGIKQDFIEPVLSELGHTKFRRHREAPFLSHKGRERVPDYVLFDNKEDKDEAKRHKDDSDRYFDFVLGLVEAKEPTKDLDQGRKENPAVQTKTYLRLTETKWGILTNGQKWRLYCKESGYSSNVYLEFDLFDILEHDKIADFKYFYAFFSHEAFKREGKRSFLDEVYEKNVKFAREVEDDLEENVYEALAILAEGFLEYRKNDLGIDDLDEIHDSSLILLYRMLFLLYAESKGLVEFNYDRNSILKIREEIREDLENGEKYAPLHDDYWRRLSETFDIVNLGSEEVLGVEGVPPYNGGLFDSEKHSFLEENRIGNNYLMRAVDRLAARKENGDMQWVDYETLHIRHLGSIYEKLLEYKLDVAEEDLTVDDGEYVEADEDDDIVVEEGEVYLKTDKGERKATGSYYTPDYIVEYIVENTIGELIDEKVEEAKEKGESEAKAILELNVLDPAMGSGHFLVGAVEYMAEELVQAVNRDIENEVWDGDEMDLDEAKREIVSHCIYGVDVNPLAVELAKLSLWLTTLSEGKPLNFLDHRLKCGNSLIGSDLLEVPWFPPELLSGREKKEAEKRRKERQEGGQETFQIPFIEAVGDFVSKIEKESDESIEDVLHKKELFDELQDSNEYRRLKTICDLHTGMFFGEKPDENERERWGNYVGSFFDPSKDEWMDDPEYGWPKRGLKTAQENNAFHWKLEFPNLFFEEGELKDNGGFDAVIGNPPYDVLEKGEGWTEEEVEDLTDYISKKVKYLPTKGGKMNLFRPFVVEFFRLTKKEGYTGHIIPLAIGADKSCKNLREWIFENKNLISLDCFPQKDDPHKRVFPEAKLSTCVVVGKDDHKTTEEFEVRVYPGRKIIEEPIENEVNCEEIIKADPKIYSVPLVDKEGWEIALKLYEDSRHLFNVAKVNRGEINQTTYKDCLTKDKSKTEMLKGAEIGRYQKRDEMSQGEKEWINKDAFLDKRDEENYDRLQNQRIALQQVTGVDDTWRLVGTIVPENTFLAETTNSIEAYDEDNIKGLLGLLNSRLLDWRFRITSTNNHVATYELEVLPIKGENNEDLQENVDRLLSLKEKFKNINIDFSEYIREYPIGDQTLKEVISPADRRLLSDKWGKSHQKDYPKLKFDNIYTQKERKNEDKIIKILVDLKWVDNIENQEPPYDYTFEKNIELYEIRCAEPLASLLEFYLPIAEIKNPGKSSRTTVVQRILNIQIPEIPKEDLKRIIKDYKERYNEYKELNIESIELEREIDATVFDLYNLTESEIETVLDSLDMDEEEKVDIMGKFGKIK